jgi:adenosine deaminase
MNPLESYIRTMPKVELHVHLEGSIRPETLLTLAWRNNRPLPYDTVDGLRAWYQFVDFPHFVDIYVAISNCLKTADDIELITREFLSGQAAQHILHSEVTYTALTVQKLTGLSMDTQLDAINRARRWAADALGVSMALIVDIAREVSADDGMQTARWVASALRRGVDAIGLGGYEVGHPPFKHAAAFNVARAAGAVSIPHAGETEGAASIWGAVRRLGARRIGHGVRCLEDPALVALLREQAIPLEVCPSSNVCLGVAASLSEHPLPRLLDAGLFVTINSDDPPLFNTTLTDEYLRCADTFNLDRTAIQQLGINAIRASLLPAERRFAIERALLAHQ